MGGASRVDGAAFLVEKLTIALGMSEVNLAIGYLAEADQQLGHADAEVSSKLLAVSLREIDEAVLTATGAALAGLLAREADPVAVKRLWHGVVALALACTARNGAYGLAVDVSTQRTDYKFRTELRVRLSETDAVGIVFFGSFANYMDVGRMDYLEHLGLSGISPGPVRMLIPGAVVHAETHFFSPARYHDVLAVYVRVAAIGRSSYTFHSLFEQAHDGQLVATGQVRLVWLDSNFAPVRVPDAFRDTVARFEGSRFLEGAS